jgi:hypothetical protein
MFKRKTPIAKMDNVKMAGATIHQAPTEFEKIKKMSTKKKKSK